MERVESGGILWKRIVHPGDHPRRERVHFKVAYGRWHLIVRCYYDCSPARANVEMWMNPRSEDSPEDCGFVHRSVEDRPIIMWSQIPFFEETAVLAVAKDLIDTFLRSLIPEDLWDRSERV